MVFIWTAPDPLNNKAVTLSIYITELQEAVNEKRVEIALAPISFINQRVGKKFRFRAITELKIEINDLAILYGYPTGVQDPALLGRDWVSMTKRFGKYLVSYPIINDMRMVLDDLISVLPKLVIINWTEGDGVTYDENNLINAEITAGPIEIQSQRNNHAIYLDSRMSVDEKYVYTGYLTWGGGLNIRKYNVGSNVVINYNIISRLCPRDFEVDDAHIWLAHTDSNDDGTPDKNKCYISNLTKEPVFVLDQERIAVLPQEYRVTYGSPDFNAPLYSWRNLTCDVDNIYVSGYSTKSNFNTSGGAIENRHILYKVGKDGSNPLMVSLDEHLTDPLEIPSPSSWDIQIKRYTGGSGGMIASQGNGFYMTYTEQVEVNEIIGYTGYHHSQRLHGASAILKINPDLTVAAALDNDRVWRLTRDNGVILFHSYLMVSYKYSISGLATSADYIYAIGCREGTQIIMDDIPVAYDIEYRILNHTGVLEYRAYNINGQLLNFGGLGIDTVESYLTRFIP